MEIEFDSDKDAVNVVKHRISLRAAAILLNGVHTVELDVRFGYGEERWIATGEIANRLFICAYTMRGEDTYRIISLRPADKREINAYRENVQG